jgi:hypothetical protein
MEENLSREHANELFRFKRDALKTIFSPVKDKVEMASAVFELYRTLNPDLPEPKIFFAKGPLDAHRLCEHLSGKKSNDHPAELAGAFMGARNIRDLLDGFVFREAKRLKSAVKDALPPRLYRESLNVLFRDVNFQVSHALFHSAERALSKPFDEESGVFYEFNPHPSYSDWDWISFYRGCAEVFDLNIKPNEAHHRLLYSGFYSGYFFDTHCILTTVPGRIERNRNLVLHHEEDSALAWDDDTLLCFWNGIHVPNRLICDPDSVTAEDILNESNAEVRRCYQEKLGSERFGALLGLVELDRKSDRFGNESVLFRTAKRDKLAGDFIYFAKVVCPSTGRSYFLCVPPGTKGVEDAVSWSFGKTPRDYQPFMET